MQPQTHSSIRGSAASGGCYQGRALVVSCAADLAGMVSGDVVVAAVPLPEYAHVLTDAGALLVGGGVLGSLVIVARELGVPAVVAEPKAFEAIATGDDLLLDGNRGVVERL